MIEMVECMYEQTAAGGEWVIKEGDPGSALYVAAEGELEVSRDSAVLGKFGKGRIFGELAILYNCTRTASVRGILTFLPLMVIPLLVIPVEAGGGEGCLVGKAERRAAGKGKEGICTVKASISAPPSFLFDREKRALSEIPSNQIRLIHFRCTQFLLPSSKVSGG